MGDGSLPAGRAGRRVGRRRGFALLLTLATVAVLALLAAGVLRLADQGTGIARGVRIQAEGGLAADAAVQMAALALLRGGSMRDAETAARLRWSGFGTAVVIEDEHGKIDLNRARADLVIAAMEALGRGADARRLLDSSRQRRFVSVDEFAGALGMGGGRAGQARRWLTVYGDAQVDRTTADPALLPLLGAAPPEGQGGLAETGGLRSALETYRIRAVARRGPAEVSRAAIIRLSPGFAQPIEWLERGQI